MNQVIPMPSALAEQAPAERFAASPVVRTDAVYVVFTSIDETIAAVRVADDLAKALDVPLTIVHFRSVPYALPVDEPTGISPVETVAFVERLRADGTDARLRVYLCRNERQSVPFAFKPHSMIVLGGHRSWWPTQAERWRWTLESAGHYVVFVDTSHSGTALPDFNEPNEEEFRA